MELQVTKPSFVLRQDGSLTSQLVEPYKPLPVSKGTKVMVTKPIDLRPLAVIEPGEYGIIDYVSDDLIEIKLDRAHYGLGPWQNHLWLVPFETEDILAGVQCLTSG